MGKFLKKERIMADNEAFDASNFATKPLLFGKWNYEDLNISDKTMEIYISVHTSKQKVFVPHTAGRYQLKRFRKASMPLVERLMGTVAYHGRNTGKKLKAMRIVKQALDIIHHHTGVNPLLKSWPTKSWLPLRDLQTALPLRRRKKLKRT